MKITFDYCVNCYIECEIILLLVQKKFGKRYKPEKEIVRKKKFVKKLRAIEKNNRENKKWQMGQNKFTDFVSIHIYSILNY